MLCPPSAMRQPQAPEWASWLAALLATAAISLAPASTWARDGLTAPAATTAPHANPAPTATSPLWPLSHPTGQQRLLESEYRQAYWPLASYFETQLNQAYCAVATAVMTLNALGVPRPDTALYPDFPFFTQQEFFNRIPAPVANPSTVAKEGMTLAQLQAALQHYPVAVEKISADTLPLDGLRALLQQQLRQPDRFVLANFNRRFIGQPGGGHWSPLAAYHAGSDSVLLLDVARYRYPPVWVSLADLLRGAQNADSVSGTARGFLLVSKAP